MGHFLLERAELVAVVQFADDVAVSRGQETCIAAFVVADLRGLG
jgi:hypothetical protein